MTTIIKCECVDCVHNKESACAADPDLSLEEGTHDRTWSCSEMTFKNNHSIHSDHQQKAAGVR